MPSLKSVKVVRSAGNFKLCGLPYRWAVQVRFRLLNALCLASACFGAHASAEIDFVKDIRPILANHCTSCHGGVKKRSGLSFISEQGAFAVPKSGVPAIRKGHPELSELITRIVSTDPDERMPPDGDPLTEEQIRKLEEWIRAGAPWERYWSFEPIDVSAPLVPPTADASEIIDSFIRDPLRARGFSASPKADRATLIRRLYLDLTGLLPSVDSVEAFENDSASDAVERVVDHLLGSPHFGERWGRHWLDQARYADSDGYEKDNARPNAWRWRQWVIDAYNRDMPLDQFVREQLAGDLLPNASEEQQLATAFHRQTLFNREGGVDPEEDRVKRLVDRVNTTSSAWMGLTVGCSQCHDHPYDPFTQREYYQLFAFFNDCDEREIQINRTSVLEQAKIEQVFMEACKARGAAFKTWRNEFLQRVSDGSELPKYQNVQLGKPRMESGGALEAQGDGSWFANGKADRDTYTFIITQKIDDLVGVKLEVLTDKRLPAGGPGWVAHGNFVLNRFYLEQGGKAVPISSASADFSQRGWDVAKAIDGDEKTGWAISPEMNKNHYAEFHLAQTVNVSASNPLTVSLVQNYGSRHLIGRFRLKALSGDVKMLNLPSHLFAALEGPDRNAVLEKYYFEHVDEVTKPLFAALNTREKERLMKVRVMTAKSGGRPTYVFHRGDFLQPDKDGGLVMPNTHSIFPAMRIRGEKADRLDLAEWLVSAENPLTARVRVNKVWAHLFGRGLVSTVDDFGTRGAFPTHPELLDWLAGRYQEHDWRLKPLVKDIVMSATYQQSAAHRKDLEKIDPDNAWLFRQNRVRVEAEIVRDLYLDAAGLLSREIGGPSFFPPLPEEVRKQSYASKFKWTTSTGAERYRRGMYTFFKRTAPDPNLITFDCPDANVANAQRGRSNTPIQALATLHNEVFVEAAQAFSKRVLSWPAMSDEERLRQAFRTCVARKPEQGEIDPLITLLMKSRAYYVEHGNDANDLIGKHAADGIKAGEQAAWIATLRIILNLDEFINRG